ncbi:unnamed protein product [Linum tenue]|uniref:Carboxypeptidase n=1 Tax=Linum tenue TaxID=586396 RepID=A0AAV0QFY8_9ROSI|nr:unnamed protein product [Linum tenue]
MFSSMIFRMFYFFFPTRGNNPNAPVAIWLNGGPGCSGEISLFYDNGPVRLNPDLTLAWNAYGWDQVFNIIYVDQPTGTGFSYSTDPGDTRHDEAGVTDDLYTFLQRDFYITGESYAGHYVPALASRIFKANTNAGEEIIRINLKGFAIGNGITDPAVQFKSYPDFALSSKLISQSDHDSIASQLVPPCLTAWFDIRKHCADHICLDRTRMDQFLTDPKVRAAIGVAPDYDFVYCNLTVYGAMRGDWLADLKLGIPELLQSGIRALIYVGEYDLICNWAGNSEWVNALNWSGQPGFDAAQTVPFVVGGRKAGELKSYGPLALLKVYDAGHMVPMDQPRAALQMIQSWVEGGLG